MPFSEVALALVKENIFAAILIVVLVITQQDRKGDKEQTKEDYRVLNKHMYDINKNIASFEDRLKRIELQISSLDKNLDDIRINDIRHFNDVIKEISNNYRGLNNDFSLLKQTIVEIKTIIIERLKTG